MRPSGTLRLLALALLGLASCHRPPIAVQSRQSKFYAIDSSLGSPADSSVARLLQPYKAGVDTQMKTVIGRTDMPLTKAQPESSLGNFMADAQLQAARRIDAKVQASVLNYGGIRLNYVAPGPLTRGTMYELMPFDNMLAIVEISGETLQHFCDFMAARKGWPVAGIQYTIREGKAVNATIGGKPIDPHLFYHIATNDYLARGGDNCDFLVPAKKRFTSVFLRDAMMSYIAGLQGQLLHPLIENRVSYAE